MDKQPQSFIGIWVLASIVLATVMAVFDSVIDPYLLFGAPRISGFNARKPSVVTQERLMKAYDVLREAPNTLILGASMVDWGLDAQHPAWPADYRPVYNLALQGSGPYISYRYLQHVISQRHLNLVVLGLDFEFFLAVPDYTPVTPEFESRLAVTRDGSVNASRRWQHIRDLFQGTLSLDALSDSTATLVANFSADSPDLAAGNWHDSPFQQVAAALGSNPLVAQRDLLMINRYRGKKMNERVMADVQAILNLCQSHGTRMILFINPVHADELEILDLVGHWGAFEDWKRELVTLVEKYRDANDRNRVQLWDFTGYDSYSSETVPMDRHVMHWFLDSTHYTTALGDAIIRRVFGMGDTQFGVALSVENLELHLRAVREQQRLYREHHSAEVRRVRDLYDSVVGTPAVAKVP